MGGSTVPFPIVVLGDSIQWGQGLLDDGTQKMAELVAAALVEQFGTQLKPQVIRFAQSGATIEVQSTPVTAPTSFPQGEVPSTDGTPTILSQALGSPSALETRTTPPVSIPPSSVQLVILDGGINDVGVFSTILNPFSSTGAVSAATTAACGGSMTTLLTNVASAYPNAVIAVTGYYPILSPLSDPVGLLFSVGLFAEVPSGWLATLLSGNGDVNPVLAQIASQCEVFTSVSNDALGSAVATVVAAQQAAAAAGAGGRFTIQGQALSRFVFVPSPIGDGNALFVGGSDGADELFPTFPALLWGFDPAPAGINSVLASLATAAGSLGSLFGFLAGLAESLLTGDPTGLLTAIASGSVALSFAAATAAIIEIESQVGPVDEVAAFRELLCGVDISCNLASLGHPNIEGEQLYAKAVAAAIIPIFQELEDAGRFIDMPASGLAFLDPLLLQDGRGSVAFLEPLLLGDEHGGLAHLGPLFPDDEGDGLVYLDPLLLDDD